jgi:hypothetical protein
MGMAGGAGAGCLVSATLIGPMTWTAAAVVPAFALATALTLTRWPVVTAGRGRPAPGDGIVDCAGERLRIGDTVRGETGFDGPMELGFGRGVVVKVGQGKAHVRFNDIPGQVHPVTPGTLRRLP